MPTLADPSVYDKNVFFMLRECEAWFLYSDIIARWFKTQQTDLNLQQKQGEDSSFHLQNALNGQKPSEIISPDKVLDRILKACFETKRKGVIIPKGYKSKMKDGTDFLLASKILDLQDRCTEVDRLVARLRTF